jgi:hypothetical protein
MNAAPQKPGRPRRWRSEAEKHREHRARRAKRNRLVDELLLAVRNATLDDPALHHVAQHGDDAALLQALTAYYQARYWMRPKCERSTSVTHN